MNISEEKIFDLIEQIYENARSGNSHSWLGVYSKFAGLVGSGPGGLTLLWENDDLFHVVASDYDPSLVREFHDHFQFICPLREKIRNLPVGHRLRRSEELSDTEWEKTEIYNEYHRRSDVYDIDYYSLSSGPSLIGGLTLTRPKSNPRFSKDEETVTKFILPHLRRSFDLFLQFRRIQHLENQKSEALRRFPQPFMVVDRSKRVVFLNDAAEEILAARDGLELNSRTGKLNATAAKDTRILNACIENIFAKSGIGTLNEFVDPSVVIQISRPVATRPMQLLITQFSETLSGDCPNEDLALIYIFDPDQKRSAAEHVLRTIYSLTPAEARLGVLLADGNSVKEAAELLCVTENTVRTHLKNLFSKTQTNRQGDLVNMILNSPAAFKKW